MAAADRALQQSRGGQYNTYVAGANGETLVYTGAGRACRLLFSAVGTVAVSIYDGTQSTGGTLIYTSTTNPTVGIAPVELDWPIQTGIVIKGTSTASHGVALCYSKDGVNGA